MKTPLWDIDPFPTLLFDPDIERATRLSVRLVEGGVPVAAPALLSELQAWIAALQLRSRPHF